MNQTFFRASEIRINMRAKMCPVYDLLYAVYYYDNYYHFTVYIIYIQNDERYNIVEKVLVVYKSLSSSQMHAMKIGRGWYISAFVTLTKKVIRE